MGSRGDPLLDPAALEGLREIGGDDFVADLIETRSSATRRMSCGTGSRP
jgi:hypothetical protein